MDTIFALASARGKAGVSVIRISGPDALSAVSTLCTLPERHRVASLRKLTLAGQAIDSALVLTFKGPASFTGEDVAELHVHGSLAVVKAVLSALGDLESLRLAEAGEFTRRALENDRLDLSQVEGLSDLIEAETEAQRRQAHRVFSGALGELTEGWRRDLVRAASLLEATIDFVDEDVPVDVLPEVVSLIKAVLGQLDTEIEGQKSAERVRDGFEVAIVGAPNVGKSTLLNALAGREAAITSEVAGTTRDVIEVKMDLSGLAVTFLDTAGIRTTDDTVEAIGVRRAKDRALAADLRIILKDSRDSIPPMDPDPDDIVAVTKSDLCSNADISSISGEGLQDMVSEVVKRLESRISNAGIATRERHRIEMERARSALGIAMDRIEATPELTELIAEDVRIGIRAMDALVGRVDVEDLLGEIFSSFCIGK